NHGKVPPGFCRGAPPRRRAWPPPQAERRTRVAAGPIPDVRSRNDSYPGPDSASDRGGRGGRGCARALGGATYVPELLRDIPPPGHAVDRARLPPATTN